MCCGFVPILFDWFYDKGISLIAVNGAAGYRFPGDRGAPERFSWNNSCAHVLSLMADGRLSPKRLITHRMPYRDMKQAYEMAYRREKEMLGVVFDWRGA